MDDRNGWAYGSLGSVLTTHDAGVTWTVYGMGTSTVSFRAAGFEDANSGWIVGSKGTILTTGDGGINWSQRDNVSEGTFRMVGSVSDGTVMAVNSNGYVTKKMVGDEVWAKSIGGTFKWFHAVDFYDALVGWGVGPLGEIYHTTDGSFNWHAQESGVSTMLLDVQFLNSRIGWVVGEGGVILNTTDSGETWSAQSSGTSESLMALKFIDEDNGWAVGAGGTVGD